MKLFCIAFVGLAIFGRAHSVALKVSNGNEVEPNSIPYQAFIHLTTDFLQGWNCNGVLISQNYVLTSTRCLWGAARSNTTLGAHDLSQWESTKQSIYTTKRAGWRIDYPGFTFNGKLEDNIGLVKLQQPAILNNAVQPAALADTQYIPVGTTGTISGWGAVRTVGETVLKSATVEVVQNSVCAEAYPEAYIGSEVICVQGYNKASACTDDGGAPLVINGQVVGIYSGGPAYLDTNNFASVVNCAGKPNMFTKVASYLDWIKANSDYSP